MDYPNVRLALAALAEIGDVDRQLATTFGLFSFWAHQSMHVEGFESCRRSLDLAAERTDLTAQVKTAVVGSVCAAWTRRADAVAIATRARSLAEQLGDARATAWAEWALAVVHGNDGRPRGAGLAVPDVETSAHRASGRTMGGTARSRVVGPGLGARPSTALLFDLPPVRPGAPLRVPCLEGRVRIDRIADGWRSCTPRPSTISSSPAPR